MDLERAFVALVVVLPFLVLMGALIAMLLARYDVWEPPQSVAHWVGATGHGALADDAALLAAWFALTAVSLWCGFVAAFVIVHALLFTFGDGVAAAGILASAVLLAAIPFAWAYAIRHRVQERRAHDGGHRA